MPCVERPTARPCCQRDPGGDRRATRRGPTYPGRSARRRRDPTWRRTIHPLVFVHGTRTSSAIWEHQLRAVRDAGHDAVAVDLPGHGARLGERFTFAGALHAIDDAVERLGSHPLLVGLSLGGYASLAYAARREHKVAGVLLAGCSTEIRGKPLGSYRRISPYLARGMGLSAESWHVVTDMLSAMQGYSALADLRRTRVPLWIVNGRRDPLRLSERRFLTARPDARLTVLPRAGHDVNLHAPTAFNRVLLHALAELRDPARPVVHHTGMAAGVAA